MCFATFLVKDLERISLSSDPLYKIRETEIQRLSIGQPIRVRYFSYVVTLHKRLAQISKKISV